MKKFTEKFYDGKVYRSFNSLWKISFYILENSIYKFLELSYLINSFLSYRHCFCSYCLLGHLLQTLLLLLWKFCLSPLLNLPNVLTGLFHSFYRLHQIKHSFHLQYEILTLIVRFWMLCYLYLSQWLSHQIFLEWLGCYLVISIYLVEIWFTHSKWCYLFFTKKQTISIKDDDHVWNDLWLGIMRDRYARAVVQDRNISFGDISWGDFNLRYIIYNLAA